MKNHKIVILFICQAAVLGLLNPERAYGQNALSPDREVENITNAIIGEQVDFMNSNSIVANNTISGNAVVKYYARKSIKLTRGFKVDKYSSFKAKIIAPADDTFKSAYSTNESNTDKGQFRCEVFPNPSEGKITITVDTKHDYSYWIYDITGLLVHEGHNLALENTSVDLSSYAKGIYVVKIKTLEKVFLKRVVIK